MKADVERLVADADASAARRYALWALGKRTVDSTVLAGFFELLKANPDYSHLKLPVNESERTELAARLCMLADVDRDGVLDEVEFAMLWRHLPTTKLANVLSPRFGKRFTAPAYTFKFGTRDEWVGGLQQKLGPLVKRSIDKECTTNEGGKWRKAYEYIVKKRAKAEHRAGDGHDVHGNPVVFDEGHVRAQPAVSSQRMPVRH